MPLKLSWLLALVFIASCDPQYKPESVPVQRPARIISLAPHLTELAFAAGAGERLVGVVAYSDYPAAAADIPGIGDAFSIDFERIAELEPDLILAWASGTPAPVLERLEALGYRVLPMTTRSLADITARLLELAQLAGDPALAAERADGFRQRLAALAERRANSRRVATFYQISLEPLYTVGGSHFISELIALCGGRNIFTALDTPAAPVTHEAVLARQPEVVLTGQPWLAATRSLWERLAGSSGGFEVRGIDPDLVARPGLRLAEGAEQICTHLAEVSD